MSIKIESRKLNGNLCQLRKALQTPAIIYGKSLSEALPVQMPETQMKQILATRNTTTLFSFELDGENMECILRDFQMDALHTRALHADFQLVKPHEMVSVKVAIKFTGAQSFRGQKMVLHKATQQLPIRCKAADIPEAIIVDVSSMKKGDRVYVKDLELPQSSELMLPETNIVASLN